ncbi:NHLP family bacteriocin export ABC transporter peptidase/permease/ATPase subunit [Aminipila butyrica]|uniref:NHLP family bacteriocin export ABC transporter peptidase/permease/ATPase subunit n=1 Tax=Aminipila butyrica TaxID=433296 RepID=A0A858BUR3_9FIRM|nr:NHLP family bacteriocin export ABC transporter peptidase/permease/ATPase subunit [Aminipila butyrica]QIB69327.1 NHLP family bacteriocin export ABC transporter peptidase/permease/ATPase subunit [Aminipila butyrica]
MFAAKYKLKAETGTVKVPMIMQMETVECGAVCLAMILGYYGKWISLEQVRKDCGVSRDGSKALNMLKAARNYSLSAKGYRYEPEELQHVGKFPCIIHWNLNHFVVLCGFKGGYAYLNDPAQGEIKVDMQTFDKCFTGICLQFEPTADFQKEGQPHSILPFVKERLGGAKDAFAFLLLTAVIGALTGILFPGFSRILIDRLLTGKNPDWLDFFLVGFLALAAIQLTVSTIRAIYSLKIEGKIAVTANAAFLWHVFCLPMEFFSQRMAGDIQERASSNERTASILMDQMAPLILDFGVLLIYFAVMLKYSVILTCVTVTSMGLHLLFARAISERRVNVTRAQQRDKGKLASITLSGIEMIETIKASGAEHSFFRRWSGCRGAVNRADVRFLELNQYLGALPGIILSVMNALILFLGAFLVIKGEMTIGMILAFQGLIAVFSAPAKRLVEAGQSLQEMRTDVERIEDVQQYPADVIYEKEDIQQQISYQKLSGRIMINDLTFGYSKLEEPLIRDFSLLLETGKSVAVVGTSGCGKSTLAKLIAGLYRPWQGEILFDERRVEDIPREVFTGSVAVVDQDIILFEDTVAANIKMWDNSIEDYEMILAARDAQLHEDIMKREGGYRAKLLEGGKNLSGGERQRMEIARVLAGDPTLLIMDEATSALDAQTEYEVVQAIQNRGITCIMIAHRLSAVRNCDEIIVMDKGKIVGQGTHEVLYQNNTYYRSLVASE